MDEFTRSPHIAKIDPEDVVVPEQRLIAVYLNSLGDIVIAQQNYPNDDDCIITVQRRWLGALIDGLNAARDRVEGNDG
jgi:hypothetical protein